MTDRARRAARAAAAAALLAGCTPFPPAGGGGMAERAPPGDWVLSAGATQGAAVEALRGDAVGVAAPRGRALDAEWIEARLETVACLDLRLEALSLAGAGAAAPAEMALARADRRRALRALTGGLPRDGLARLADYRRHVQRVEGALAGLGRPASAGTEARSC